MGATMHPAEPIWKGEGRMVAYGCAQIRQLRLAAYPSDQALGGCWSRLRTREESGHRCRSAGRPDRVPRRTASGRARPAGGRLRGVRGSGSPWDGEAPLRGVLGCERMVLAGRSGSMRPHTSVAWQPTLTHESGQRWGGKAHEVSFVPAGRNECNSLGGYSFRKGPDGHRIVGRHRVGEYLANRSALCVSGRMRNGADARREGEGSAA